MLHVKQISAAVNWHVKMMIKDFANMKIKKLLQIGGFWKERLFLPCEALHHDEAFKLLSQRSGGGGVIEKSEMCVI